MPTFEVYIQAGIRDLVENQVRRGIDKNFAQLSANGRSTEVLGKPQRIGQRESHPLQTAKGGAPSVV